MHQKKVLLGLACKFDINRIQWRNFSKAKIVTDKAKTVTDKAKTVTDKAKTAADKAKTVAANAKKYDVVVIGGGIVGVASAREMINRHPHMKMAILEKEDRIAYHQSGHNSGVVHAGIYYIPGSLKAKLCVEGMRLLYKYFDEKKIPYKKYGKLIVATNARELEYLNELHDRGTKNQVPDLKVLCQGEIKDVEPYCDGLGALWSPHTGNVDYALVTRHMAKDFCRSGGEICLNFETDKFVESTESEYPISIISKNQQRVVAKHVLTCCGLQSDRLAVKTGCSSNPIMIPFRGEYLVLAPEKRHLVKGNIYPVPDPRFPFLGVHCTPTMDGNVLLGPNAVLAFSREGYGWTDVNVHDMVEIFSHAGFRKLALQYVGYGLKEMMRSAIIPLQVAQLNKFLPDLAETDVVRGLTGVRAQALDITGKLVGDFIFDKGPGNLNRRIIHCRNAPSPGATSSMAIAKMIADKMEEQFKSLG